MRAAGRAARRFLAAGVSLTLALGLAGCSDDPAPSEPPPATESAEGAPADATPIEVPPPVARGLRRTLTRRALALRRGDRAAFLRSVADDASFRDDQTTYFDNLQRLPVTGLRYRIHPRSVVRTDDDYWVVVRVSMQLDGYDAVPVTTMDRYRFSPVGASGRRFLVSSVTDTRWEEKQEVLSQPWDLGPIEVRERDGVLGIFDAGSVDQAPSLLRAAEAGVAKVGALVPYEWSGTVVVYALSDPTFLRSIDVPGGDPDQVDGVTVDVRSGPDRTLASSRIVLHPDVVARPGMQRNRLVRHELTHVAVGEHDDSAPLWLAEGLAEWVSTRPIRPEDRSVPDAAVSASEDRKLKDLPDDAAFDDTENDVDYAISWWAVEHLVSLFGRQNIWTILDELDAAGSHPEDDADARLQRISTLNTRMLARKAAKMIVAAYAEPPEPEPSGSSSPGKPGETQPTKPGSPGSTGTPGD